MQRFLDCVAAIEQKATQDERLRKAMDYIAWQAKMRGITKHELILEFYMKYARRSDLQAR